MKIIAILMFTFLAHSCKEAPVEETNSSESGSRASSEVGIKCNQELLDLKTGLSAPESIEDAVDLINALPKPISISCFVQALQRPLRINATSSILSAQPADGVENPRVFIFGGDTLFMSIVSDGIGAQFLEFSQLVNNTQSIKGELMFPITANIEYSAPYDRIVTSDGTLTSCSACHLREVRDNSHAQKNVFISAAAKPKTSRNVTVTSFIQEYYLCDANNEVSDRCSIISSIFGHGEVVAEEFPATMPTWKESLGF